MLLLLLLTLGQIPGSIGLDPRLSWYTRGHDRIAPGQFGSCPPPWPASVPGSLSLDPRLSWYTLESDHFSVHFSSRGRPTESAVSLAREVLGICEETHATLTPVVNWAPNQRTQVIIADFFDYSNGWAAPFPWNTITVIPTLPAGSKTNEGDWLRTLILHEYSHILQVDQVAGVPKALRSVFGRIIMPNALAPAWLNEGYAVYNETRFTDFGRLRSAEYDMFSRAAADSGKLLSVDRCGNYELRRFPAGGAPYLYGSRLHGHVAARGDSGAWDRYNHRRSSEFPFLENHDARDVFGKSIYSLWAETHMGLVASGARTSGLVASRPLTPLRVVTREGFWTGSPLWSRYGTRLYYISETGREYPAIKMVDTATGRTTVLHRGLVTGTLSLSADGRMLAFAERKLVGSSYEHTDIYALDLNYGGVRQLTHGRRARDPDFAQDTSLVVFVSNDHDQNNLNLLDIATGEVTVLTETEDHTAYHSPRFSPGGKWIAVGVNRPDGYADIELVDRATGWSIPVTQDRATDLWPAWSRTGKCLFFVSDRSGVFNLYAYQLATGQTSQVTNVLYGVFEPSVSPDNRKIAIASFSASGYDIATMDFRAEDWQPASPLPSSVPTSAFPPSSLPVSPSPLPSLPRSSPLYYYNPFPTILPAFWLPWISASSSVELGAFTLGWDALQFHQYQVAAGYRFGRSSPFLSANYTLRRYRPALSAAVDLDLETQAGNVNVGLPFLATRSSNWLDLEVAAVREPRVPNRRILARASLGWTFSDARQYRFCVAPVEGRIIGLSGDVTEETGDRTARPALRETVPGFPMRLLGYCYHYFGNPPQSWSLRAKLAAGTATADDAWQLAAEPGLLGVRGYSEPSPASRSVLAAGLQYRTPLWWIERGLGTGPLFIQNINAAAFSDFGMTSSWPETANCELQTANSGQSRARIGIGAELRTDFILAHLLPANLHVGFGFGLNPFWSYQLYFGLSSSMLEGILYSSLVNRQSSIPVRHLPENH